MIETDWITEQLVVGGVFYECQALTSFFEWSGPPIVGVEGVTIQNGRVVSEALGSPRFGSPEKMLRVGETYDENTSRYTVHEDATLELCRIRTEDSTKSTYFMPSEKPLHGVDEFEGTLTMEQTDDGVRVWHQRTRFSMEAEELDNHVRVCTPFDTGLPEVTETRAGETGLGEQFEPLMPVRPMADTLNGASVR